MTTRHHPLTVDQVLAIGKALVEREREQHRYEMERFNHYLASGQPPWKAEGDAERDAERLDTTPLDMAREHGIDVESLTDDELDGAFAHINVVRDYLAIGLSEEDARILVDPAVPLLDPRKQAAYDRYRASERRAIERHNDVLLAMGADEDDLLEQELS
jgi:hypothetical protein